VAKWTFEKVKEIIESENYKISPSFNPLNYKGVKSKINLICPKNHEWISTFDNFNNNNRRCKKCGRETTAIKKRRTEEDIILEFKKVGFTLIDSYENYKSKHSKLKAICENGHFHFTSLQIVSMGHGCPYCAGVVKYTIEQAREIFSNRNLTLLADNYIGAHGKMPFTCDLHSDDVQHTTLHLAMNGYCVCSKCLSDKRKGKNNPMWDDSISDELRYKRRSYPEYHDWRKNVLSRDNYTCVCCEKNEGNSCHAHHLDGYFWCIEKRTDIDNGVTLCANCHLKFHSMYGRGFNTKEQFEEYLSNKLYINEEMENDYDYSRVV